MEVTKKKNPKRKGTKKQAGGFLGFKFGKSKTTKLREHLLSKSPNPNERIYSMYPPLNPNLSRTSPTSNPVISTIKKNIAEANKRIELLKLQAELKTLQEHKKFNAKSISTILTQKLVNLGEIRPDQKTKVNSYLRNIYDNYLDTIPPRIESPEQLQKLYTLIINLATKRLSRNDIQKLVNNVDQENT